MFITTKRVCFCDRSDFLVLIFSFSSDSDKLHKDVNASVSQVVHQLIDLLRDGHPENRVRGCYHALFLISEVYSFPPNTPKLGIVHISIT